MIRTAVLLLCALATACGGGGGDSAPARKHLFLAVDNGMNQLLRVDEIGDSSFTVPLGPEPRDLQLLGDDRVLVSERDGYTERDLLTGEELARIDTYTGVQTARRLPDGSTLLGSNSAQGVVLSRIQPDGALQSEVLLPGYSGLRLARFLVTGNTLLTVDEPFRVLEVDPAGMVVWEAELPGKGYMAERLPDGSTAASTGGAASIVELDSDGEVQRSFGGLDAHDDVGLDWFSGFHRFDDGHYLVANWLGHGKWGMGPHLLELDADNEIIWTWADHDAAMQITHLLLLDSQSE